MKNKLVEKIIQHSKSLNIENIDASKIRISKFFHGNHINNRKFLFLVSYSGHPLCMIKICREREWNRIIDREVSGLKFISELDKSLSPKVFFADELEGLKFVCEEFIDGFPVGQNNETEGFKLVSNFHHLIKKDSMIEIGDLLAVFDGYFSDESIEFATLSKRKSQKVYKAPQHGDLTYKNIIKRKNTGIAIIDWENFGLRPIWGTDLVHYITRLVWRKFPNRNFEEYKIIFIKEAKKYLMENKISIDDDTLENLFLIDRLFDLFQKASPDNFADKILTLSYLQ